MSDDKPDHFYRTSKGDARGYIKPSALKELWFHTGTACNLSCSFCLEGSKPGDKRIEHISFDEALVYLREAEELGVEQFSFTGGEPFVAPDMIKILDAALDIAPCLVLTNGTEPLIARSKYLDDFLSKKHDLSFRVSIDSSEPKIHDRERGEGNFFKAFETMKMLVEKGFKVSIARHEKRDEDSKKINEEYQSHIKEFMLPLDLRIVSFPDFLLPGAMPNVPEITESCMTTYLSEEQRQAFMCRYSKMLVKKNGRIGVYACTLVDDDEDYDYGTNLKESLKEKVLLGHHRCYSCFAFGASCSES